MHRELGTIRRDSVRFGSFQSAGWQGVAPRAMHHSLPECCNQRTDLARPDRARTALLPLSTLTSTPCSLSFPPTIHHLPSLAVSLSNPSLDSASATTYYYYSYYYRAYETLLLLLSLLLLLLLLPPQYFLLSPPQPPSVTIEAIPDIWTPEDSVAAFNGSVTITTWTSPAVGGERKMGTFLPLYTPPCRCSSAPPSFASLSTEPVSTSAMNDRGGGGLRFFRFTYRRNLSNRAGRGGGTSVCIWSQECTARSFSMSCLDRARACTHMYTYTYIGIATNPHIIVLPLSACVFYG